VTRILIADDHAIVRFGLRGILEAQPNWEVVAEAADGSEAVAKAIETAPDVAIVDYSLPLLSGIEVTKRIRKRLPGTEVLVFTMHDSERLIQEFLQAGARGYLLKSDAGRDVVEAVQALTTHRPYFTSKISEALLQKFAALSDREGSSLTARERQVVQLITEGDSHMEIGKLLNIAPRTVETHRAGIMRKLNISSSAALVRYAVRNKLVEP
jgi:DNA-binding NarL/FixJ family response regulator